MRKLLLVLVLILMPTMAWANTIKVKATGYFPFTCTAKERAVEGGRNDRYGKRLRTLQDYKDESYVSVATDPRIIPSGSVLEIKEFPDIKFLACDVGKGVRGKHIDICVKYRRDAYELPKYLTVKVITNETKDRKFRNYFHRTFGKILRRSYTTFIDKIQELERYYFDSEDNTRLCMVWNDRFSQRHTISTSRMGCGEASVSRFCHR